MNKLRNHLLWITFLLCSCSTVKSTPKVDLIMARFTPQPPCELFTNEEVTISIWGTVPSGAQVWWKAEKDGKKQGVIEGGPSTVTLYKAPSNAGQVTIIGEIFQKGQLISKKEMECSVIERPTATTFTLAVVPSNTLSATTIAIIEETSTLTPTILVTTRPTSTDTPTPIPPTFTFTATLEPATPTHTHTATSTVIPAATDSLTETPQATSPIPPMVGITEIMANPCGGQNSQEKNEYVELFNYDTQPVDLGGWLLMASNNQNAPDKLVSWNKRMGNMPLGEATINSTVLPSGGYAVVLSPNYTLKQTEDKRPYNFPKGTVILTFETGYRIGNEAGGLISSKGSDNDQLDGLLLYTSQTNWVERTISTYGVILVGKDPHNLVAHDGLPRSAPECQSVQRRSGIWKDVYEAWTVSKNLTPGNGPYLVEP